MRRKTKIICTIGPASKSAEVLDRMIVSGMDGARINFSHGRPEDHLAILNAVRESSSRCGKIVSIMGDLQGPKIRVGDIGASGKITLVPGESLLISPSVAVGEPGKVGTTYAKLAGDLAPGDTVLLDDGLLRLSVEEIRGRDVVCRVEVGGVLSSHKGINLPGVKVGVSVPTEKDLEDLEFMIRNDFDYVALSFVQSAEDVLRVRKVLSERGSGMQVVAKIEKPAALDHLEQILEVSDVVMVARGDLGVELSVERVPSSQKRILQAAAAANVLSITATQMLESMTHSPVPTRAEASDVANAVYDGTDALLLTGETAAGAYPVETVEMAGRIAHEAEKAAQAWSDPTLFHHHAGSNFPDAVCHAAAETAMDLGAAAIVVGTQTGKTALLMSKFRPRVPIVAISSDEQTIRRMSIIYGVCPVRLPRMDQMEESIELAADHLLAAGLAVKGDVVVMTFGAPLQGRGLTNTLRLITLEKDKPGKGQKSAYPECESIKDDP